MPKFIYPGPAQETTAFGQTFPKGEPVEVTGEHAVKKLTGNPCFETEDGDAPEGKRGRGRKAE